MQHTKGVNIMDKDFEDQELAEIITNDNISKDTKITLGFMISLITLLLAGVLWINDTIGKTNVEILLVNQRLSGIELNLANRYNELENKIDLRYSELQSKIDSFGEERFLRYEFESWKNLLEARNPEIKVPQID